MKEATKDAKCELHNIPIIKIQLQTHRLLCENCLCEGQSQRRQRLEMLRLRLNKIYQVELSELKQVKDQTDRLLDLFQSKNMTEAKKLINKASPEVQKIVQTLLERQIKEANIILKDAAQIEMEKWKAIDGRSFSATYISFEQQQSRIDQRLTELKQSLKVQIGDKLKQELRSYYCNLFEF